MPRRLTIADLQGRLVTVHGASLADEECSECGHPLHGTALAVQADTGIYCSRRCAASHGAFLLDEMTRRHRAEATA